MLVSPVPEISVVLPTHNRLDRLPRSIGSVLAQRDVELELIVVDDGSTDGTHAYLQDLASSDPRVRVLRNEAARGAPRARNRGASHARGGWIAFNDDDCVWEPTKLFLQGERMRASGAGVVYCREAVFWPGIGEVVQGTGDAERRGAVRSLTTGNYIGTPGPLIERVLFERVGGFDERLPRLQDWDLWLTLGISTRFAFVGEVLTRGEHVGGGISSSAGAMIEAARMLLSKWRDDGRLSRRDVARLHYGIGKFLLGEGLGADARRVFREGVRVDAGSPINWLGLIGSALPPRQFRVLKRARIALRRRRSS